MEEENEISNSELAYNYLIEKGMKSHHAAGLVGNLMQESYQLDKIWADGKVDNVGSKGIMQWHGPRLDSLYKFQKEKDPNYSNGNPISLTDQLDYILHESETGAGDKWLKRQYDKAFSTTNAEDATLSFSKDVIRPHKKYAHNEKRLKYASTLAPINTSSLSDYDVSNNLSKQNFRNPELLNKKKDITNFNIPKPTLNQGFTLGNQQTSNYIHPNEEFNLDLEIEPKQEKVLEPEIPNAKLQSNNKESYTDFIQSYLNNISQNKKSMGGEFDIYPVGEQNFNEFNEGGTHEQNPLGGIPQGLGSNGKMNTVEEGETSFDFEDGKYIFSDRIKLDGTGVEKNRTDFANGGELDPNCGGPGQPPCPKRSDSLKVYNSSINFKNKIKELGYKPGKVFDFENGKDLIFKKDGTIDISDSLKELTNSKSDSNFNNTIIKEDNSYNLNPSILRTGGKRKFLMDKGRLELLNDSGKYHYLKDLGNFKYSAAESASYKGYNTNLPYMELDSRIVPTNQNNYELEETEENKKDYVSFSSYDPLQVKPFDMLSKKEIKERYKKYGKDGFPPSFDIKDLYPKPKLRPKAKSISKIESKKIKNDIPDNIPDLAPSPFYEDNWDVISYRKNAQGGNDSTSRKFRDKKELEKYLKREKALKHKTKIKANIKRKK